MRSTLKELNQRFCLEGGKTPADILSMTKEDVVCFLNQNPILPPSYEDEECQTIQIRMTRSLKPEDFMRLVSSLREELPPGPKQFLIADAEEYCRQYQMTLPVFFDLVARGIVNGYLKSWYSWVRCDNAINRINRFMIESREYPNFADAVFLAFDAGEYHPKTEHVSSDEVTRPLIEAIVKEYPVETSQPGFKTYP